MKNFIKEFKEFALKGNVFDMAVGIMLGGAISALVNSLVENVLTPIIGMIFGEPDFSAITLGPVQIGSFINAIISFLIIAFVLFLLIRGINRLTRKKEVVEEVVEEVTPTKEELLLTEIRDLLSQQNK